MKLRTGVIYLTALLGACSYSSCSGMQRSVRSPSAIVERHIDKSGIELKCDDVAKISADGSIFYACEEDTDPELIGKLEYIAAVKKYGMEKLGLKKTTNYQIYKNGKTDVPETRYRLYVSDKSEIPQKWKNYRYIAEDGEHRSIVEEPTLFHSKNDTLLDEEEHYSGLGFDTHRRSYTGFVSSNSSCNLDPKFLEQSAAEQAADILHEELHVITDKESNIEESFVTLISCAGAIEITEIFFGNGSEEHEEAEKKLEFRLDLSKDVVETNSKLLELYGKDISLEEKLAEKEKIMDASKYMGSNAEIWSYLPYTKNFFLVYEVHKKHPDLEKLVQIFIDCPKTEEEGIEYLKGFL